MRMITGIFYEAYILLNKMSPYLLFGFLFAGLLRLFIDTETVKKHLGKGSFMSVFKATLFGIPLPLCSCSVIPSAMSLRKEGASRGAVLSFLISTPTTGVDSILATYSLLGGFFMFYRVLASFFAGLLAGVTANLFITENDPKISDTNTACKICNCAEGHDHGPFEKIKNILEYAFVELVRDTGKSILAGIMIGAVITFFVPENFIKQYMGTGLVSMVVMLLVGVPMYVCATASIPIAAALMAKGLSAGAAFVFLVAGPATNAVTIAVVLKSLGKKALTVYLGSIVFSSLFLGVLLDKMYVYFYGYGYSFNIAHSHDIFPGYLSVVSSVVLLCLISVNMIKKEKQ